MSRRLRASALVLACATALLVSPALIGSGARLPDPVSGTPPVEALPRATPGDLLEGIAERPGTRVILAGDSLTAGDGAGSYAPESREQDRPCHRSSEGIFAGVVPRDNRVVVACSRATVADVVGTADRLPRGSSEERQQLAAIREQRADAVVLLVGANDIGFPQLLDDCLVREGFDCSKDQAITSRTTRLTNELAPLLETLYSRMLETTGAEILIPAYPDLLDGSGTCGRISGAERGYGRSVISELNSTIATAVDNVRSAHDEGRRLRFAAETADALRGHGPCSADAWINPYGMVSLLDAAGSGDRAQEILHPTATGYAALTRALLPYLGG